ncbi:hypothetical protein U1Q18_024010 [Sarracenia purpurea var. burkii]
MEKRSYSLTEGKRSPPVSLTIPWQPEFPSQILLSDRVPATTPTLTILSTKMNHRRRKRKKRGSGQALSTPTSLSKPSVADGPDSWSPTNPVRRRATGKSPKKPRAKNPLSHNSARSREPVQFLLQLGILYSSARSEELNPTTWESRSGNPSSYPDPATSTESSSSSSSGHTHKIPWLEKYRPTMIADVVGNGGAVSRLQVIARDDNMPNLILAKQVKWSKEGTLRNHLSFSKPVEIWGRTSRQDSWNSFR